MSYQSTPELRGVWGLEDREYSDEEVVANDHLQWAVHAGALVKDKYLVPFNSNDLPGLVPPEPPAKE